MAAPWRGGGLGRPCSSVPEWRGRSGSLWSLARTAGGVFLWSLLLPRRLARTPIPLAWRLCRGGGEPLWSTESLPEVGSWAKSPPKESGPAGEVSPSRRSAAAPATRHPARHPCSPTPTPSGPGADLALLATVQEDPRSVLVFLNGNQNWDKG